METLFRFNIVREANRSRDEIDPIDLIANTQFQRDATGIPGGAQRPARLKALAKSYIATNRFVDAPRSRAELRALDDAAAAIDALIEAGTTTRADVDGALTTALGGRPAAFIAPGALRNTMNVVGDSIIAIKLSPEDHYRPILRLAAILRAYHLILRFSATPTFPADAAELTANQRRTLRLPEAVLPTRPPAPPREPSDPVVEKLRGLATAYDRVNGAIERTAPNPPRRVCGDVLSNRVRRGCRRTALRPEALFREELDIGEKPSKPRSQPRPRMSEELPQTESLVSGRLATSWRRLRSSGRRSSRRNRAA